MVSERGRRVGREEPTGVTGEAVKAPRLLSRSFFTPGAGDLICCCYPFTPGFLVFLPRGHVYMQVRNFEKNSDFTLQRA